MNKANVRQDSVTFNENHSMISGTQIYNFPRCLFACLYDIFLLNNTGWIYFALFS